MGTTTFTGPVVSAGGFTGPLTGAVTATTVAATTSLTVTSASADALAVGLAGATNPAFKIDSSTASQAAGLKVTGAATGGTVAVAAIDSGSNTNLTINAKGSGTIGIGSVSTGAVTITPATNHSAAVTVTSASASALAVGLAGATNPSFVVDSSTGSQAAGLKVTGAATGGTVAVAAIDSGSNTNLTINGKGSGTIGIGSVSTGAVTITPATTVTGAITPTGGVAAAGGFSVSPRCVHTGGTSITQSTDGTEVTITNTVLYVAELFIPANCTVTGASVFWGATTDGNAKVALFNSAGTRVALSASTDVSGFTGDSFGTRIAFASPYAAVGPATYYLGVICDTGTNTINTHILGNFGAGEVTGLVYATEAGYATITPPTTFTTAKGPIATLY